MTLSVTLGAVVEEAGFPCWLPGPLAIKEVGTVFFFVGSLSPRSLIANSVSIFPDLDGLRTCSSSGHPIPVALVHLLLRRWLLNEDWARCW